MSKPQRKTGATDHQKERVIELLNKDDLDQKDIAELVDVSPSFVSGIKRGLNGQKVSSTEKTFHPITGYVNKQRSVQAEI